MMTNNEGHGGEWLNVGNKNKANGGWGHKWSDTGATGGNYGQADIKHHENVGKQGRLSVTKTNKTHDDDGMQSYNSKTGYIKVCFMTGYSNVFNVAWALKQLLASARDQDDEFTILQLPGIGKNLWIGADVPNYMDGIEQYFRHDVKFNNINGRLRTHNWALLIYTQFFFRYNNKVAL
jgi:hypothetical protein